MIVGVTGLPGRGKTLYGVRLLLDAARAKRLAVANFHSRRQHWQFALWDELSALDNAVVVVDEAHMWFSARTWQRQDQETLAYFQQHRKEGIDLYWIAQHEDRVDVAIREVTNFYHRIKLLTRSVALVRIALPEERRKTHSLRLVYLPGSLRNEYWTNERIGLRDGSGYSFGKGSAFGRASVLRREDGRLVVAPNLWSVTYPDGRVVMCGSDELSGHVVTCRRVAREARTTWDVGLGVAAAYRDNEGRVYPITDGVLDAPAVMEGGHAIRDQIETLARSHAERLSAAARQGGGKADREGRTGSKG